LSIKRVTISSGSKNEGIKQQKPLLTAAFWQILPQKSAWLAISAVHNPLSLELAQPGINATWNWRSLQWRQVKVCAAGKRSGGMLF
jgi:hypothetical protein